ncbi:MAG: aldo/keto reductase, partial [Pseudomonadota bacterium]
LAEGAPIVSNQVSFSLVDRRAREALRAVCDAGGVKLLAYGTLCGGFLTDRWLGAEEPARIGDWSRMKYKRFIDAAGGWEALQTVLRAARAVADRHGVSIANVATRWVLDQSHVGAVIIGARLGESEHRGDNAKLFGFALDEADRATLEAAFEALTPIPGDCGDEYRRPPYLTASGDLSHHLDTLPTVFQAEPMPGRPERMRVSSGSVWEPLAGYSRAVRVKDRVYVSGTTATHGVDHVVAPSDAGAQATYTLDKIVGALHALGAAPEDVVRTRILLSDIDDWEAVSRAHGRVFGDVRPANTLVAAGDLVGDYKVEIEAEAIVD